MRDSRDKYLYMLWAVVLSGFLSGALTRSSADSQQDITSLVGAPAPDCTWDSAVAQLDANQDFLGWWSAEADNNTASMALGYVVYRFTLYDWPKEDDRMTVEGTSFDQVACMAVERVKQLEARR